MNILREFLNEPVLRSVGWVLVHFVWQGTAVALLLVLVLWMLKRSSANIRYLAGCTALGLMLACPVLTFLHLNGQKTMAPTQPSFNLMPSGSEQVTELPVAEIGREPATPATQMAAPPQKLSFSAQLEPWLPWIAGLWASAVLVLSLRLFAGWLLTRKLRHRGNQPLGEEFQELLAKLCQQLQVRAPVQLLKSTLVEVPTVVGWLKPVILLPVSSLAGLSPSQLEAILAHELAHIRRHDFLVNLLQSVAETLLFYHPAVWWVSGWIRQEREHCCDDITLQACGDRVEYARALATLEEMRNQGGELALAAGGGELLPRIQRILGLPSRTHAPRWWLGGALAAVLMLLLIALQGSKSWAADEKQQKEPATKVEKTPRLQFRLVAENPSHPETELVQYHQQKNGVVIPLRIRKEILLDESSVRTTSLQKDPITARQQIEIQFTEEGAKLFGKVTAAAKGRQIAILFDGKVLSAPVVQESIPGGKASITGDFSDLEAAELLQKIKEAIGQRDQDKEQKQGEVIVKPQENLNTALNDPATVTKLIEEAQMLIREGKLDDAEAKLKEVVKQAPENQSVFHHLNSIKEARFAQEARKREVDSNNTLQDPPKAWNTPVERKGLLEKPWNTPGQQEQPARASSASATNSTTDITKGRRNIHEILSMTIPGTIRFDGRPLRDVVVWMNEKIRALGSETGGILITLGLDNENTSGTDPVDPITGARLPKAPERIPMAVHIDEVRIFMTNSHPHLSLSEILDSIVRGARARIKYSVEGNAIVFRHWTLVPSELQTRIFQVEPNTFMDRLELLYSQSEGFVTKGREIILPASVTSGKMKFAPTSQSNNGWSNQQLRDYLVSKGIYFATNQFEGALYASNGGLPKSRTRKVLFFNDRTGIIFVRATEEELKLVENAINLLNTAPLNVKLEARFIEIDEPIAQNWMSDMHLGTVLATNNIALHANSTGVSPVTNNETFTNAQNGIFSSGRNLSKSSSAAVQSEQMDAATNLPLPVLSGILTEDQKQTILQAIANNGGISTIGAPQVITQDGQRARVDIVEQIRPFILPSGETNTITFGHSLEVVPKVTSSGISVKLDLLASKTELIDKKELIAEQSPGSPKVSSSSQSSLPQVRARRIQASVEVPVGSTAVLMGMPYTVNYRAVDKVAVLGDIPILGRLFRSESSGTQKKRLMLLVTPIIVDAGGNSLRPNPTNSQAPAAEPKAN